MSLLPLADRWCLSRFTCGSEEIDKYARKRAHREHAWKKNSARVQVLRAESEAIGFYALSLYPRTHEPHQCDEEATWLKGFPLVFIDYLAVSKNHQRKGWGKFLTVSALLDAAEVIERVGGVVGVGLRPIDAAAKAFFLDVGFQPIIDTVEKPLMALSCEEVISKANENR